MHYYGSGQLKRKTAKTKGTWRSSYPKKRSVRHYEEAAALRYANPFRKVSKKHSLPIKGTILPILFLSWLGLLLYLPFFQINNFSYSGLRLIKSSEIEEEIQKQIEPLNQFWPKNNYFFVDQNAISQNLQEKFSFNDITVKKVFPNSMIIGVEEKVSSAIYDNGEGYYMIDKNGDVLKFLRKVWDNEFEKPTTTAATTTLFTYNISVSSSATGTENISTTTMPSTTTTLVLLHGQHTPDAIAIKKQYGEFPLIYNPEAKTNLKHVLPQSTVKAVLDLYNGLKKSKIFNVKYFTVGDQGTGITVTTDRPWIIKFSPEDIDLQITNLRIILKNSKPKEYVDLRFGERIYWK